MGVFLILMNTSRSNMFVHTVFLSAEQLKKYINAMSAEVCQITKKTMVEQLFCKSNDL